jgi:predicted short-subunit dehydrogenase-like oxidoreductase (DUF2520 family)
MKYNKVTIIGGGKVGCVLGKKLSQKNYKIVSVISRTFASAVFCADFLECNSYSTSLDDISDDTNLIMISVPDHSIKSVAKNLSYVDGLKLKGLAVFHTSGSLTSKLLLPLKLKGARTFSLHPFQTFVSISSVLENMKGVYYGVEGPKDNLKIAKKIVEDLEGKYVEILENLKPIYHIAGVFASNYLITLIQNIYYVFDKLKIESAKFDEILKPIINQTLQNLSHLSPFDALTGPIVRGDNEIIDVHLKTLSRDVPDLLRFYISMGLETLEAAKASGRVTQLKYNDILKLFIDYIKIENLK